MVFQDVGVTKLRVDLNLWESPVEVFFSLFSVSAGFDFYNFNSIDFSIGFAFDFANLGEPARAKGAKVVEIFVEVLSKEEVHRCELFSGNQSLAFVIN